MQDRNTLQNLRIINIADNGNVVEYSKAVSLSEIEELQKLESWGKLVDQNNTQVRKIGDASWLVVFNFVPIPQGLPVDTEMVPF